MRKKIVVAMGIGILLLALAIAAGYWAGGERLDVGALLPDRLASRIAAGCGRTCTLGAACSGHCWSCEGSPYGAKCTVCTDMYVAHSHCEQGGVGTCSEQTDPDDCGKMKFGTCSHWPSICGITKRVCENVGPESQYDCPNWWCN